jgi:lysophospholipase L1-like esterase
MLGVVLGGLALVLGPRFYAMIATSGSAAALASIPVSPPGANPAGPASRPTNPLDPLVVSATAVLKKKPQRPKPHFSILQIGDSHTAADFFSGRVRDLLQQRFGPGGIYLPPGIPHAGIRSAAFAIKVSPGWDYQSMAKSDNKEKFWLTGYTAAAATAQAEITFTSPKPVRFDAIDVSFLLQPGAGSVDILLDGTRVDEVALDGPADQPLIHRLMPVGAKLDSFRQLSIRTASAAPVALSGVFVEQRLSGVSYFSVGFPGATVSILKRIAPKNFTDDLTRIAPDMIVLAFGTNEGFDDRLDLAEYRQTLKDVIQSITTARPEVKVVVIGPPPGARIASDCATAVSACSGGSPAVKEGETCWSKPPHLDDVRGIQKEVTEQAGAIFWDWSLVLPSSCDLEQGKTGNPALFGPDRVHLTQEGYRRTADAFAAFLTPLVKKGMASR